jgi:hypothetical protein
MVITAVALLGEFWPACQDIEDLELLVTEGPDALAAAQEARAGVSLALPQVASPAGVSLALPRP